MTGWPPRARRIVLYVPRDIIVITSISYSPILKPTPRTGEDITNTADLDLSITDTLSASSGEQVKKVEELEDFNPAIFTDVHNYSLAEISIKLPKDQLYEDELEQ